MITERNTSHSRSIPLQWLILLTFVVQIFGAVGLVAYLSYRSGHESVNKLASRLKTEISTRVTEKTTTYLQDLDQVNKNNISALRRKVWSFDDFASQERQAWEQMQLNSLSPITIVGFGTPSGGHRAVELLKDGTFSIRAAPNGGGKYQTFTTNPDGSPAKVTQTDIYFDSRQRPWFQVAVQSKRAAWTHVYPHIYTGELLVAIAEPIYDLSNNNLLGVTYGIRTLEEISRFLRSIDMKAGAVFIMESDQTLVATSMSQKPYQLAQNAKDQKLLKANDSPNLQIRATAKHLSDRFGSFTNIRQSEQFDFEIEGDRQLVQAMPIRDRNGLDWLLVVVIPESDFTANIQANKVWTMLLCGITLVIATGISFITTRWITKPILRLSQASKAMAEGEWLESLAEDGVISEMNSLSILFNQMSGQLRQALEQKSAEIQDKAYWLNTLVEAIPDPIFMKDGEGKYLIVNGQGLELFKMSDDYFGKTDAEMAEVNQFYRDALLYCANSDEVAWQQGVISKIEEHIPKPDGSVLIFDVTKVPLFNQDGSRKGLVVFAQDISDRRKAELALNAEMSRRKALFDASIDGIVVLDQECNVIEANASFARMLGYSLEEVANLNVKDFDAHWTIEELDQKIEANSLCLDTFVTRHRRKDGSIYDVEISTNLVDWYNQSVNFCICRDISDRKKAEQKLRQSRAKFQRLVDDIGDKFVIFSHTGMTGLMTYISSGLYAVFGLREEDVIGKYWIDVVNWIPESIEIAQTALMKILDSGADFQQFEMDFIHPDGTRRTIQVSQHPVMDGEGNLVAIDGIVENISDRKRLEMELTQSRDLREVIFDEASDALFLVDSDTLLTIDCNQQAVRLFEVDCKNDLINIEGHILQKRQFTIQELSQIAQELNQRGFWSLEVEYVTRKGREFWGDLSAKQITFEDRRFQLVRVVDITTRKQTEIALAAAMAAAEEATKAKSAFLASMSHEIRTPMNGVIGMTQILEMTELTNEQEDCVKTIKDSGEALLTIINDILDFSKIESGMLEIEARDFVLEEVVRGVCKLLENQAIAKQVDLQYTIAPNIPTHMIGDRSRLRQILLNLVGNAVKFTQNGQVTISVSGRALPKSNQELQQECSKYELTFAIADTGIGIPSDRIDKLFQPFTQADASISRQYGGTGLGLAISKRLAELMGGTIWVESLGQVGGSPPIVWKSYPRNFATPQGSTFYFAIAILINNSINQTQISSAKEIPIDNKMAEKFPLRILLVEDNRVNQMVASSMLKRLGYQLDAIANDGFEAVQAVQNYDYDLILMDVQMPKMDGLAATKMIRTGLKSHVRIVAMTADAMPEDRQACLDAGMDDYISKPINIQEIMRIILSTK
jgi:PAS domain S-box-containing protein